MYYFECFMDEKKMNMKENKKIYHVTPELSEMQWKKVGKVEQLYMYPLKSCKGIELKHCDFTEFGISFAKDGYFTLRDRMFLVINENNNKFQTARQYPKLVLISVSSVDETSVKFETPEMPELVFKVPKISETLSQIVECSFGKGEKVKCMDCGPDAAKWISRFISGTNSEFRMVCAFVQRIRKMNIPFWEKYLNIYEKLRVEDTGLFADLSSYMLLSKSSLDDLNERLEKPISALQLRPNILVSGSETYSEDNWEWIKIGESAVIRNVKPCTRCRMTRINPKNAEIESDEPLETMKAYRQLTEKDQRSLEGNSPIMGINCGLYISGRVKVGDSVYVYNSEN